MTFHLDEIAKEKISAYSNKLGIIGNQTVGSQLRKNSLVLPVAGETLSETGNLFKEMCSYNVNIVTVRSSYLELNDHDLCTEPSIHSQEELHGQQHPHQKQCL
ncbi:hypothetical protein pdam_00019727 [Pocillopora damicornis]|uniref:Uncharacterized protein n=1 Tax=Pocillopora damicornis TaxID=46731 RepID=A0A3M6TZ02_POCDA|nr:hypothetical protein pdam_00019727 [Pocillopora damicornis]